MQNGNVKIKDLFNGDRIFNIPKYQRAYSWEENNLEYFLDDLKNQRSEKSYFLGTLLFHEKEQHGDYEFIDVVDGQQRLTTIIIFMSELIKKLIQMESTVATRKTYSRYVYDEENYKLELENEDNSFLHNIFGSAEVIKFETPSQKKLYEAKNYFSEQVLLLEKSELEHLFSVLTCADVILYVVNKISDATQIFELLNDRGRSLTNLEGIKSFLMYRIGCLDLRDDGEQAIDSMQDNFSSMYRNIEKNNISENDVLRYHTIAFEESKITDYSTPKRFVKNKINQLFDNSVPDNIIKDEITNYVQKLRESFILFDQIKTNKVKVKNIENLIMIGRVNPFYPLLMHTYKNNNKYFDRFTKYLVKFTFRATFIGLRNKDESFYSYIRDKDVFVDLFKWIVNDNWWNINGRVSEFLEYRNYFEWINKNIVKYILFSYENHLRSEKGYPLLTIEIYFSTNVREKLNIEHITAQNGFIQDIDDNFEEKYLHALGNLVIDTTSSNSRKGNKSVDKKMTEYIKAPIMSQNEINEQSLDWNNIDEVKKFIDQRNDKLVDYIKNYLL